MSNTNRTWKRESKDARALFAEVDMLVSTIIEARRADYRALDKRITLDTNTDTCDTVTRKDKSNA